MYLFGHHDCPEHIRPKLRETIINLILNKNVDMFYVGNHGHFDAMVHSILRELQTAFSALPVHTLTYPHDPPEIRGLWGHFA